MILVDLELGENLRDLPSKRILRDILADRIGRAHMVVRSKEPGGRPMQLENVAREHQMHLRGLPPSGGLPYPRDEPCEGGRLDIAAHADLLELAVRPVADAVKPRFLNMQVADNREHNSTAPAARGLRSVRTPLDARPVRMPAPRPLTLIGAMRIRGASVVYYRLAAAWHDYPAVRRLSTNSLPLSVHLEVVGGNRVCAAWGHAAYTGNLHPL